MSFLDKDSQSVSESTSETKSSYNISNLRTRFRPRSSSRTSNSQWKIGLGEVRETNIGGVNVSQNISEVVINSTPEPSSVSEKTEVFNHKTFITNENWSSIINIQARILTFSAETVTCECLIDGESFLFENRDFPLVLFKHLKLDELPYVLISIKTNIGSLKIDVYNGNDFVNKSLFEDETANDKIWNEIIESDFIKPFAYNPK